jgi:hypothetical protein
VDDIDVIDVDTERLGYQLRKGGLMALAVAVRSGQHGDGSGRVDSYGARLVKTRPRTQRTGHIGRRDAASLYIGGYADTAELAAFRGFLATFFETGVIRYV